MPERFPAADSASARIEPFGRVLAGRKRERELQGPVAIEINGIFSGSAGKNARGDTGGAPNRVKIGLEIGQGKLCEEFLKNAQLMPQRWAAAARTIGLEVGAVFMPGREGIVERIEGTTSGQQEIPRLAPVSFVFAAEKAGFVVSDRFVESIVGEGSFRICIVEVCDAHASHEFADRKTEIRAVLCEQMLVGQRGLLLRDPLRHSGLPDERHLIGKVDGIRKYLVCRLLLEKKKHPSERRAVGPGFILNFENDVIKAIRFPDQLSGVLLLKGQDVAVFERGELFPIDRAGLVDVVGRIEGTQIPLCFAILRRKQGDLDDNAAPRRFSKELAIAAEV